MLTQSEKRVLLRAVSRYTRNRLRLRQALQAALNDHPDGDVASLLQALIEQQLLSQTQAQEVSAALNQSAASPAPLNGNGSGMPAAGKLVIPLAPTLPALDGNAATALENDDEQLDQIGGCRLLRKLGQGGMCAVYLGFHEQEHRQVAVKILPPKQAAIQAHVDRFYREAKSGALLNHANIVKVYEFGQDQATGRHYLILEFVDGFSALELLHRQGQLPIPDAVHIILDIARGLEHAHSRNIIHRDIKPDNILLTKTGVAKLADMGLAKRTDEPSHLTAARQGFGTPYYMPYEQAINAKYVDGRSDIYALGATFYHLLTGEVPFTGDHYLDIVDKKRHGDFVPAGLLHPDVPPVLDDILELMLARDPKDRYQTVSELIVDLERANLAPAVPSFVDADLAYQDPVVRERLAAMAQSTRLDLHRAVDEDDSDKPRRNIWYLRYRVRKRQWCKARATTSQVLKRLREDRIPLDTQAATSAVGDYQPLSHYHEFRSTLRTMQHKRRQADQQRQGAADTEITPERLPSRLRRHLQARWSLYLGGTVAIALLSSVVVLVVRLLGH